MRYFAIGKALLVLSIFTMFLIPLLINHFDDGHDKLSVSELQDPKRKLKSLNLELSGKILFDHLCQFDEFKEDGSINNRLYYIPFVPLDWTNEDRIESILILDSGRRGWDSDFSEAIERLEVKLDSLMSVKEYSIIMDVSYKKYEIIKFEEKAMSFLRSNPDLKFARNYKLRKLVHNENHSLSGILFGVGLVVVLLVWLLFQLRLEFKLKSSKNEEKDISIYN